MNEVAIKEEGALHRESGTTPGPSGKQACEFGLNLTKRQTGRRSEQ